MKFFSPLRLRVEKNIIVRIQRNLKDQGMINVSLGQEVTPSDIVGTATISAGFRIIKLAQILQVNPNEIEKYMKKSLNQRVYKDELLASRASGKFGGKNIITSPTDGILDFINPQTGEIRLTFLPKKQDLPAGVYGIVESVDKAAGKIMIRTQVSRVNGMFGSGMVRDGILHVLSKRDEIIGQSAISAKLDGKILVGGSLVFQDTITAAISDGVSGIISGGINARDYQGMAGGRLVFPKKLDNDIGIAIVVCEGFGSIPIGEDIFNMLKEYNGRFVSLDGNKGIINLPVFESDSMIKVRQTSLVYPEDSNLVTNDQRTSRVLEMKSGVRVRVIGNSYSGEQGIIIKIDQTETLLPSGIKTIMVTIETRRRKIQVPVANCEVIL